MDGSQEMEDSRRLKAAIESKNWFEALHLSDLLLDRDERTSEILKCAAKANIEVGNNACALLILDAMHRRAPENTRILIALIRAQAVLGDAESALRNFSSISQSTHSINPKEYHGIRLEIGELMLRLNRLEELKSLLQEWKTERRRGPRIANLEFKLMQAEGRLDEAAAGYKSLTEVPNTPEGLRLQAFFDLSKVLDRLGRYDEAFAAARHANEHPSSTDTMFDQNEYRNQTDRMIRFFTSERLKRLQINSERDDSPVFIIGMPRSGTTLTEQVIAAHPNAAGIGEQREPIVAGEMLAYLTGTPYPECLENISESDLAREGARYLQMSRALSNNASRVTNKALGLERSLGFIQQMLPGARAIFVRRQPIDNVLSIYLHPLQAKMHPWSRSIEDIIFVRKEFDRMISHWMEASSLPMFELEYENFTRTQKATTGRILEFLDLPAAEECLQFHRSKRYVRTPSYDQVDKPLNQNAIERWRNYERHLGPAIEAFGE